MPYSFPDRSNGPGNFVDANHINAIQDAVENMGAAAIVVAGPDAPAKVKDRADFLCDGTNDQVELAAARDALGTTSGVVCFVGTMTIGATLVWSKNGTALVGIGHGHKDSSSIDAVGSRIVAASGFTGTLIDARHASDNNTLYNVRFADFHVDGKRSAAIGIRWRCARSYMQNVGIEECTSRGLLVRGYTAAESGSTAKECYDNRFVGLFIGDIYDNFTDRTLSTDGVGCEVALEASDQHFVAGIFLNSRDNVSIAAGSQQFTNCHTYDAVRYNVHFNGGGSRTKIVNLKCEGAGSHGIFVDGATTGTSDIQIVGSNFKNNGDATTNTADHIHFVGPNAHTRPMIVGCAFSKDAATANLPRHGINVSASTAAQSLLIDGCQFGPDTHFGSARINDSASGSTPIVYGTMQGYKAQTGGASSVANGGTIAHGLGDSFGGRVPRRYGITATVAGHIATVTAASGTSLTIALHNHDGTAISAAENVSWWAEL